MTQYVFGFIMYGVRNPWSSESTLPVLYVDGALSATDPGLPSELTGCTIHPRVHKRPGVNWGADPRNPAGIDETATVTLTDDELGTLGTLFLKDDTALRYGLQDNKLSDVATTATVHGKADVVDGSILFLENEAIYVEIFGGATARHTTTLTLTRGVCGSTAQVHSMRPAEFSEGEDGSEDRLYLDTKPNWEHGFRCGVYLFELDQYGAIASWVLRRGVIAGEPTPRERPLYDIDLKWAETAINSHTIGEVTKEVALSHAIRVTDLTAGFVPRRVQYWLTLTQASLFFNEALGPRGAVVFGASSPYATSLSTRLFADASLSWEVLCDDGVEQFVHRITSIQVYNFASNGHSHSVLKVSAQIQPGGYRTGANAFSGSGNRLRDWYSNATNGVGFPNNAATNGFTLAAPPKIKLRLKMRATVVTAFLKLCISRDGSSGGAYDKLIGGIGAGLPASWFNVGTPAGSALSVLTNTAALAELAQLLPGVNTYYFDLTQGISMRDFLTNEFIASQLLLGSLQSGLITLRTWVHELASTITLNPVNKSVMPGERLAAIKRLDLEAGTNVLTLEPLYRRSVRWQGAQKIKPEEVQRLRFWRDGLNLSVADVTSGALSDMVRAFYKVFGGAPRVYEVTISLAQYISDGIEFGDAVAWADTSIPTPQGIGIDDDFFVIGVDLNWDEGLVNLKLLQNTLLVDQATVSTTGKVAPTLKITAVSPVSSTVVDVTVSYVGAAAIDVGSDHDDLYVEIYNNAGRLRLDTYDHAPSGAAEKMGSVEAYPTVQPLTASTMRLTFDSAYLRGAYTTAASMIVAGESKLNLSGRLSDEVALDGALIEPEIRAASTINKFIQLQPSKLALTDERYHFGA